MPENGQPKPHRSSRLVPLSADPPPAEDEDDRRFQVQVQIVPRQQTLYIGFINGTAANRGDMGILIRTALTACGVRTMSETSDLCMRVDCADGGHDVDAMYDIALATLRNVQQRIGGGSSLEEALALEWRSLADRSSYAVPGGLVSDTAVAARKRRIE